MLQRYFRDIHWNIGLQLKRLNFISNMAVNSNNKCNGILVVDIIKEHLLGER